MTKHLSSSSLIADLNCAYIIGASALARTDRQMARVLLHASNRQVDWLAGLSTHEIECAGRLPFALACPLPHFHRLIGAQTQGDLLASCQLALSVVTEDSA